MRDIIFRGFHPDEMGTKKVLVNGEWIKGEWVKGSLVHQTNYYGDKVDRYHIVETGSNFDYDDYAAYLVIPETVGQYTGLTDKNGKKIFEGDIFKDGFDLISVVEWAEDGRFLGVGINRRPNWDPNGRLVTYIAKESNAEVIGNLYENPELLEV